MMNLLRRTGVLISPGLQDLGTVSLGTAAIFLTRAFPTSDFGDFDWAMLLVSAAMVFTGMGLRYLSKALG